MQMRLSAPVGADVPDPGTIVPFHIGERPGLATVVRVSTVAGHPVIEVVVPDWVADHLDRSGCGVHDEAVPETRPNGLGAPKWHQTRTAHGALAPFSLASV